MQKIKLGLIGVGGQGRNHLLNCLRFKGASLLAAADISKKALLLAKRRGVKNLYYNYEKLLKNENVDAVIIALPNFLHLESAIRSAEAGKDILLEKPLAINVEEGRKILSSVKKNGVNLMLGYPFRFHNSFIKMHERIADGYFGEVHIVDATNVSCGPFSARSNHEGPSPVPSWWFQRKRSGGGALLDLGSHLINLLIWYFGEIVDARSYLGHTFYMDLEDYAIGILKFKNGPIGIVKVGWFSKDFNLSIQVVGTAKNSSINFERSSLKLALNPIRAKIGDFNYDLSYKELKYFLECLQLNISPAPSGEEGLMDLRAISMLYKNSTNIT